MQNYPADYFTPQVDNRFGTSVNKYVYFRQNFLAPTAEQRNITSKVLVNPHFNKKVFVNPNYRPANTHVPVVTGEYMPVISNKIHINPKIHTVTPPAPATRKILVNPKVLRNIPVVQQENPLSVRPVERRLQLEQCKGHVKVSQVASQKLASPAANKRIRRLSIHSKFKIVRSQSRSKENEELRKLGLEAKIKLSSLKKYHTANKFKLDNRKNNTPLTAKRSKDSKKKYDSLKKFHIQSKFKLDNRKSKSPVISKRAKFVFVNKCPSTSDIAKTIPVKMNKRWRRSSLNLLNISGIMYKNSTHSLRRTSPPKPKKNIFKIQEKSICKSKYKLVKRISNSKKSSTEEKKSSLKGIRRSLALKKPISNEKLRKCNIPCIYYQRFGKCKRKDMGKCNRKHDPDQIALCTKFLQGACIDDNCLLSHNVSSEKMPTCKFYLEGSCSKDQCPYTHVRISPKADICRDFLEGFCKKALECDKRHQFLCPDYEKKGCSKPRCPYPHGKMVRKYSVFNKHKFAKKSSDKIEEKPHEKPTELEPIKTKEVAKLSKTETARYYLDKNNINEGGNSVEIKRCVFPVCNETVCDQEIPFKSRPKLGKLPSFIAFEDT
ncbi:zinc finger CCCH domain-containing protein 3 [Leptinotarsa decemlineata]|uniref:zinc finger CCCH domain-containing protein 3 n=1 Tax=Leptinotarsa decemlineata TaxID=7539 RepID=UPI003D3054F6